MKNVEKFFQYSNSTIIYVYISFSFLTFSYYDIEIIPCLQLVNVSHSPAEKKKIHTNKKNTSANDRYTIDNSSLKTLLPYSDLLLFTIHSPSEPPRATRQPRKARPGRPPAARWRWRAPSPRTFWARSGTAASLTLSSRSGVASLLESSSLPLYLKDASGLLYLVLDQVLGWVMPTANMNLTNHSWSKLIK